MDWDYADRLQHTQKGAGSGAQHTYFTYDASGQRVRKVGVASGTVKERIYQGGYEIYRERADAPGATTDFERQTLHVMDDQRRVAMAETKTREAGAAAPTLTTRWSFQLDNHLGSATLELDDAGSVISYEEYHPYGSTAFRTADGAAQVSAKRYRYTGKEKDEETGLYYHGARYYAPWLARWTAADPLGTIDGPNLYAYARCSPTRHVDTNGMQSSNNACDPQKSSCAPEPEANSSVSTEFETQTSNPEARAIDQANEEQTTALQALRNGEATLPTYSGEDLKRDVAVALHRTDTKEYKEARQIAAAERERQLTQEEDERKERSLDAELPGVGASLVPVLGSGKSSYVHFRHGNYGRGIFYAGLAVSDVFLVKALASSGARLTLRVAGSLTGGEVTRNFTAAEAARFTGQGFTPQQAQYLAQEYSGMGHHFLGRRLNLPLSIQESSLNVLSPTGISRGRFYELHFKADPYFFGTRLPAGAGGGVWRGAAIGLTKPGFVGRLWYGVPAPLAIAVGTAGHAAGLTIESHF